MSTPQEDLAAMYDVDLETEESLEPDSPERFRVRDKGAAAWAMGRLRALHEQMAENDAIHARQALVIDRWRERANSLLQRQADFFTALLQEYHGEVLREDPRARTISLPGGALKARKTQPEWIVEDPQTLIQFLLAEHEDLVRVKREVDKAALKKTMTPNLRSGHAVNPAGEIVPGLVVEAVGFEIAPGEFVKFGVTLDADFLTDDDAEPADG